MRPMWGALNGGSITWQPVSSCSGGRDGGGGSVEGNRKEPGPEPGSEGEGAGSEGRGRRDGRRAGRGSGGDSLSGWRCGVAVDRRGTATGPRRPHPPGDVAAPSCLSRSGPSGLSRRMLIDAPNSSSLKAC